MLGVLTRLLGAVVAGVVLVAGSAVPADAGRGRAPEPVRILVVGDSVSHGSAGDWTWRYRLWENLTGQGVAVDFVGPNEGVLNAKTDELWDRDGYAAPVLGSGFDDDHAARWGMGFATMEYPIGELVAEYDPDVVIEMLGTNDLAFYGATPDDVAAAASEFVREARAVKPGVSVVLGHVPDPWVGGADRVNWWLDVIARDRDAWGSRVVATEAPVEWVKGVDTYDPLHPSAVGEVKIAEAVAGALARIGVGARPEEFPVVENGPATPAGLRMSWGRSGEPVLAWRLPVGATGVHVWRRDVTAGGVWERVEPDPRVEPPLSGHVVRWRVQAFKGSAVSPLFSNAVQLRGHDESAPTR